MKIEPPRNREDAYAGLLTGTMITLLGLGPIILIAVQIMRSLRKFQFEAIGTVEISFAMSLVTFIALTGFGLRMVAMQFHWLRDAKRNS